MKTCPPWGLAKPRTVGGALVLLGLLSSCDRRHPLGPSFENFASVTAGDSHTCGLTTGGAAFCWGLNYVGQLGIGSAVGPEACAAIRGTALPCSQEPVAVAGAITFSELSAGGEYSCGLTAGGLLYCWGSDVYGQLGNGSTSESPVPVLVTGGLRFSAVTTGHGYTCALTTGGAAYCW